MTPAQVERRAVELLYQHGLTPEWSFGWDNARRRRGLTDYRRRMITLSRHLTPHRDAAAVEQTLLHEIAHALVGSGHGHDRVWLAKAREIGYTGGRCSDDVVVEVDRASRYVATCDRCDLELPRHRVERHLLNRPAYRHRADGGTVTIKERAA